MKKLFAFVLGTLVLIGGATLGLQTSSARAAAPDTPAKHKHHHHKHHHHHYHRNQLSY